MTSFKRYVIDSSALINAARTYYAFDLAPKFWSLLESQFENGNLLSIDRVQDELLAGDDALSKWTRKNSSMFKTSKDQAIATSYGQLQRWAHQQSQYTTAALSEFAIEKNADPWLVAWSNVHKDVLVTFESQTSLAVQKRIPIPNACRAFGVEFCDLFEMMRKLGMVIA